MHQGAHECFLLCHRYVHSLGFFIECSSSVRAYFTASYCVVHFGEVHSFLYVNVLRASQSLVRDHLQTYCRVRTCVYFGDFPDLALELDVYICVQFLIRERTVGVPKPCPGPLAIIVFSYAFALTGRLIRHAPCSSSLLRCTVSYT